MNWEWGSSEDLMARIRGSQIADGRIEPDGFYLTFSDSSTLVIVCLPSENLGLALIQGDRRVH